MSNFNMSKYNRDFKIYLGHTKKEQSGIPEPVYLNGFKWDCNWYWGGGYIGNKNFHAHFDGAFLKIPDIRGHILGEFVTPWTKLEEYQKDSAIVLSNGSAVWEPVTLFLNNVPEKIQVNWWRIKDLYKQFYILKEAAEVFRYGGHCSSKGRTDSELKPIMSDSINLHIATVIIPEICKALGVDKNE